MRKVHLEGSLTIYNVDYSLTSMKKGRLKWLKAIPVHAVYQTIDSPVGTLTLLELESKLASVFWDVEHQSCQLAEEMQRFSQDTASPLLKETARQLKEYFIKKRVTFSLPLLKSGTAFQQRAWQELQMIPYGQTISYKEQAVRLGDQNKARAVGLANGLNPLPIIIPCHRVIGSNRQLTGFAGGLDKKAYLLKLEQN